VPGDENFQESRMREIRTSGLMRGEATQSLPYSTVLLPIIIFCVVAPILRGSI